MFTLRLLIIEWPVAGAKFPANTLVAQTGFATHQSARGSDKDIRTPWGGQPCPYSFSRTTNRRCLAEQESPSTICSWPTTTLLEAAGMTLCTKQSCQVALVLSTSLSASSDTVTSLYRVLFHLSLM